MLYSLRKHLCSWLAPRRLSLSMLAEEGGKEKTGETSCFTSYFSPFLGPLRFDTSHSRFTLASVRKTKRLGRRLSLL